MNLFKLSATLGLDSKEYEKAIGDSTKKGREFASSTSKSFADVKNAIKALASPLSTLAGRVSDLALKSKTSATQHKVLSDELKAAKAKVKSLSTEYVKSAKESGTTSKQTHDLRLKLDEAKKSVTDLRGELKKYPGALDKAKASMSKFGGVLGKIGSAGVKGFGVMAKGIGAAVTAAGTAVTALGAIGLNYNAQMETYTTNFKVMLGSSEQAAKKVEELKAFAAKTPFEMGDLAKATQTLLSFNVANEDTNGVLRQLGDISLGNSQKLETLTRAYGKMNASQKVTLEDINMMIDAGYNPLLQIQEKTGESMTDLYERISDGEVSFSEIQEAIAGATSEGGQFYKGMEEASKTTQGLISTLKDNAKALVGKVFMPISEGMAKTVLPSAIAAIDQLTQAFEKNGISGMIDAASEIVSNALTTFTQHLPDFLDMAFKIVNKLADGIENNLPEITDAAITTLVTFVSGVANMIPRLADLAFQVVERLGNYLLNNMPEIVQSAVKLFTGFINKFVEWLPKLIPLAFQIVTKLATSLIENIPELAKSVLKLGTAVVDGIIDGISAAWDGLVSWFNGIWNNLFGSRSVNVNVNESHTTSGKAHAGGLEYVPYNSYPAELHRGEAVLTARQADEWRRGNSSGGGVTVIQHIYSEAKTAADLMQEARYEQEKAVLLGV